MNKTGFTLIELVIIIVVVAVAIGALLTALASTTQNTIYPLVMQTATQLAEQEVERLTGTRFSYVCPQGSTTFATPFDTYSYSVDVRCVDAPLVVGDSAALQHKRVIVTVSNNTIGNVKLETIVTNRGVTTPAENCSGFSFPCP